MKQSDTSPTLTHGTPNPQQAQRGGTRRALIKKCAKAARWSGGEPGPRVCAPKAFRSGRYSKAVKEKVVWKSTSAPLLMKVEAAEPRSTTLNLPSRKRV